MLTTRSDRRSKGRALRGEVPRSSHAIWVPGPERADPVSLLQAQDEGRLEYLLPIKYGRMVASPFAFLRGSAVVMAADLATTPTTGIEVELCGDAHLSNFGVFATPERKLVFDINDFDETLPGPWEWDLKRLAASAVVAGRDNGFDDKVNRELSRAAVEYYGTAMGALAQLRTLDVWHYQVEADRVLEAFERSSIKASKSARKMVRKARGRTHEQTLEKLTHFVDGRRRIISDPPLLVPLDELLKREETPEIREQDIQSMWLRYLESLPKERRMLLSRFRISDAALRVGGVGSVGTRCTIMLIEGDADDDALLLQQKEAGPSVLEPYVRPQAYSSPAERIVIGQRLMQASSDIFLGWHQSGVWDVYFYWRQLKDMKGSLDAHDLDEEGLATYLRVCGACLARAHARTGDGAAISGYIGKKRTFANAVAEFAVAYADQTERDHQALVDAVNSGRIAAETGV
jgi:uncharacterized protein (DUF2252 family)